MDEFNIDNFPFSQIPILGLKPLKIHSKYYTIHMYIRNLSISIHKTYTFNGFGVEFKCKQMDFDRC